MPTHHIVLTKDEFDELRTMKMVPLDELPISDSEKAALMEAAKKKTGGVATPQGIPLVVCGMVDDVVVCNVVRTGREK